MSGKPKVTIRSITTSGEYDDREKTQVLVGNEKVGEGSYGGEPEDNMRSRDYRWVEPLLKKLAEALGAEVEVVAMGVDLGVGEEKP